MLFFFFFFFWVQKHPNSFSDTIHTACEQYQMSLIHISNYPLFPYFFAYEFFFFFFFWVQKHPAASLVLFTGTVHTAREQYQVSLIPMSVTLFLLISLLISFCFFFLYSFFFFLGCKSTLIGSLVHVLFYT